MMRALFLFLVAAPLMTLDAALAQQDGGVQVAPVMIAMSAEHNIASLRVRNGRSRAIAFGADAYDWRQENGRDILTPARDLMLSPGLFEIGAGAEQVVRLGVLAANANSERAFRVVLRELPGQRQATPLAFELSLPVFIAPIDARGQLEARGELRAHGHALVLANSGRTHVRIASVETAEAGLIASPRYLLAGSRVEIPLPSHARTVRLLSADIGGAEMERIVNIARAPDVHRLR
jgi:fimbrial chaperone protein